jgi:hypothetical protein
VRWVTGKHIQRLFAAKVKTSAMIKRHRTGVML